jgi:succinate dehydrogenase/fumarate reductase flavoprotein subunit
VLTLECDVLVVGLGGAGASAAIAAAEAGSDVIVIEKMEEGGGSTRDSGGSVREFSAAEAAVTHYTLLTEGRTPPPVVRACVEGAMRLPEWFANHGGRQTEGEPTDRDSYDTIYPTWHIKSAFADLPGAEGLGSRFRVVPEGWSEQTGPAACGVTLWQVIFRCVQDLQIPVLYSTRGERLIQDATGRVVGAKCSSPNGNVEIAARRGVVLSCGGFADDPEMKLDVFGVDLPTLCSPGRRSGDGIRMAQAVGAGLWHMGSLAARFGYKVPEYDAAFLAQMLGPGFLFCDRDGSRYIDESILDSHATGSFTLIPDAVTGEFMRIPSFLVFDEETRYDGPIASTRIGHNAGFSWSRDNSSEIDRGWIVRADSLDELALKLELPRDAFITTVNEFNRSAEGIIEDPFGRNQKTMRSIASAPFYGIAIWPCLYNTQGGPRRDERARVLDAFGDPIAGLYSAGELGSMWSTIYPGAGNVTEALVFGQIAGLEAASL